MWGLHLVLRETPRYSLCLTGKPGRWAGFGRCIYYYYVPPSEYLFQAIHGSSTQRCSGGDMDGLFRRQRQASAYPLSLSSPPPQSFASQHAPGLKKMAARATSVAELRKLFPSQVRFRKEEGAGLSRQSPAPSSRATNRRPPTSKTEKERWRPARSGGAFWARRGGEASAVEMALLGKASPPYFSSRGEGWARVSASSSASSLSGSPGRGASAAEAATRAPL